MHEPTFGELVRSDFAVWRELWSTKTERLLWGRSGILADLRLLHSSMGLRATILYRLSHASHRHRIKGLPLLFCHLNITLHGLDIPAAVEIGSRLYIPHPVGTVVMARTIGHDVTLVSGVTIGMRNEEQFPTIGSHVFIGAGARVLGGIRVGDQVRIGANAVVLHDVPSHSVAVGVPAHIRPLARDTNSNVPDGMSG